MDSLDTPGAAVRPARRRKLDRSVSLHVTLPATLGERVADTAARLGVTRSMLAQVALERGLKLAADSLRARLRRERDADADATGDGAGK